MTAHRFRSALILLLSLGPALSLRAQARPTTTAIDERWRPFLGCWSTSAGTLSGPMVCVAPTSDSTTVEMLTVVRDSITMRVPITVSGARVGRSRDGCAGWESASWSADERRIYTASEFTCPRGLTQQSSGMLAFGEVTEEGQATFSRIERVRITKESRVRMLTYVSQLDTAIVPAEILRRLPDQQGMRTVSARMHASAPIGLTAVAEASKAVDPSVVEVWLGERGQGFALNANALRTLKSQGVPDRVIDVMVAVSNPKVFTLAAGGQPGVRPADPFGDGRQLTAEQTLALIRQQQAMRNGQMMGGFGMAPWGLLDPYFFGMYDPQFGYGGAFANRWGYYSPFFWNNGFNGFNGFNGLYGNGFVGNGNGWLPGNTPIIVTPVSPTQRDPARVVNGRGYSEGASSSNGSSGQNLPSYNGSNGGGSASSGGYSGGGSSSGSSTSGSSSSGSSSTGGGERTAKPRP
jgi:hypothetical protein